MLGQPFSTRPAYVQSIRGLLRLHLLTETSQDESPEAQDVRDSLERPWYDLSGIEKQRIAGLSEDLYSISEPSGQPLPTNPRAQRKLLEAIDARQSGDWDRALELLRRWGEYLDPAMARWRSAGCGLIESVPVVPLDSLAGRAEGKKIRVLAVRPGVQHVGPIVEFCQAAKISTVIDHRYRLSEVPEALRYLGEGHAKGKVVVIVE